tara:strand:+ start:221 stop:397 length:177 start_codon:yes stop_codon:yes gene_type:complete
MKHLLAVAVALAILPPAFAQNSIVTGHGCGTGCSVSIEQLGLPFYRAFLCFMQADAFQ